MDLSGNVIAIFGFLIYLEIIEFEFCNLNYNSRKSIIKRSIDDVNQSIVCNDVNEEDDEDEEDEKDEKEERDLKL